MGQEAPAIGIDLGTTNSCVAVYQRGQVEIIVNDHGHRTTPSCVVFNEKGRLIGEAAKEIITVNPTSNTVYDVKRLIGRRFDDSLQSDISHLPMVITNHEGNPKIGVEYKGEAKTLFPEEISAMVLLKMKESAEAYLGKTVTKAVITVPAHFNDSQRRATKDAGRIAGLNVLRIMNETSAAALAYAFKEKDGKERNLLVFNLGEWSCDVSVVAISGGSCTVKSTRGDRRLGGEHFNSRMMDYFIKKIKKKSLRNDLAGNKKALVRLRASCNDAKKLLSSTMEAAIEIDSLLPSLDFKSSITRQKFEELNDDLFYYALELIQKTIRDAGMNASQIQKIILVGGSTRIPKIQTLLQQFLIERELHLTIHVEEVVAFGAAIQASILQGDKSDSLKDLLNLVDVAQLALGIGVGNGDIMTTMIERYSTIPVSKVSMFWIDQRITEFPFAEGQRIKVEENKLLGRITVKGLRPSPKGLYKILVTFSVGADGILDVSAVTEFAGPNSKVTVTYEDARLSEDVIARLVEDAKRYSLDDVQVREQLDLEKARDSAIDYCHVIQSRLEKGLKKCKQVINTLGTNEVTSKEEIEQKKQMIECILNEIRPNIQVPVVDEQQVSTLLPVKVESVIELVVDGQVAAPLQVKVEPVDESYENQAKTSKRKRSP